MYNILESNPIDAKESLVRELYECEHEAEIEFMLDKMSKDIEKFTLRVFTNKISSSIVSKTIYNKIKNDLLKNVLSIIRKIRSLRDEISNTHGAIYNEERVNIIIRLNKLNSFEVKLSQLLRKLKNCKV